MAARGRSGAVVQREHEQHDRPHRGDHDQGDVGGQREALKIAAGFRSEEAFQAGVSEQQALDTVLPRLSRERALELASECLQVYVWDRLGCDN